jgi:hypothetical protein
MCATGSLNANPVGWYVLLSKVLVFFVSLAWIAFNYIDQTAEDYPLVKMKYRALLCITPLIIVDAVLQFIYFSGLDPVIITSCCGSLFSAEGAGIVSSMSSFPLGTMMTVFYVSISAYMISAFFSLRSGNSLFKYLTGILAFTLLAVSVMSVVSFISLYFYELPTHHCPFDILQKDYFYIGYPLYVTLFLGVFFGMMAGIVDPYQKYNSIAGTIQRLQKKWIITSVVMILIFTVISSWQVIFSDLSMKGYQ